MIDRNRNPQHPNRRDRQDSDSGRREDENFNDIEGTTSSDHSSVADDRGMRSDRDRRSFSGDREGDALGSETEDLEFDESDELDSPGDSER
jgi:hypothetical protein